MEIDEALKQATAYKKSEGFSFALDFLMKNYDENMTDDLPRLLDKIYTYFSKDINNQKVKNFISELINSKKIEQYSGLLSTYYWMLKDYESYKLTLMNQISKVNPNNPWQYCYDLKELQSSLCGYYSVMGLDEEKNAIEYLYNLISSMFFDVACELMVYDSNLTSYHMHLKHGSVLNFYHPERLISLSESINEWFNDDSDDDSKSIKTLKCTVSTEKIIQIIKQKIFSDFPKQLGFKIDILNIEYKDTSKFALTLFRKEVYNDILTLNDNINKWKIQIANKTVNISTNETNNILNQLYKK